MKASAYDPTDDILRLTANGATEDQIRHIIDIRRRMWPIFGQSYPYREGEPESDAKSAGSKTPLSSACPFLNLVENIRAFAA